MKKLLAFAIIILFIGINVVSSSRNQIEDINDNEYILDAFDTLEELLVRGHIAYGYISYDPSGQLGTGPVKFELDDPGNLTKLGDENVSCYFTASTWTSDGRWLCIQYGTGILFQLDPETGEITVIGGGGNNINELAYDPVTNKMYGVGDTALFSIDTETGGQTVICPGSGVIGIACDKDGSCYGVDSNNLYTIDLLTGQTTLISPLLNFSCSAVINAEFDIDNDILYLIGYTTGYMTGLYTCDTETGECNLVGQFEGGAELTTLAIPFNWSGPATDFTWAPSLPKPGEAILFNASYSYDPNGYITLYEWDWNNDGVYEESHIAPTATHSWASPGSYLVTLRVTDNESLTGKKSKIVEVINQPPVPPVIHGQTHGKVGVEYEYNFSLSDLDDDSMYLIVDWGNGTSGPWQGPYKSDTTVKLNHTWNKKGTFTIRTKAKDIYGAESDWGTLKVTMPKNQQNSQQFLNSLFFKIVQRLLNTR